MDRRTSAPLDAIPTALAKTGFLLEHAVSEQFRAGGWTVIGNRFYVDDVDGRARELDLVAYQIKKGAEVDVCTCVLVSCKKDAENTWAFMSKDKPATDPNFDWDPVHSWTSVEPLNLYLRDSKTWHKKYVASNESVRRDLFTSTRDVFAFQLVSPDGKSPKNDKPIFDCITGLLKALDHEIAALPERQKDSKRLYLFTLLAVVEAPLVDVQYQSGVGKAVEVGKLLHLARYMVRRREFMAHVHFVRSDMLAGFIQSVNDLSDHNATYSKTLINDAYKAIATSDKVRDFLSKKCAPRLMWRLNTVLRNEGRSDVVASMSFRAGKKSLEIQLDLDDESVALLNSDPELDKVTKRMLKDIARYEGAFVFTGDVPF